MEMRLTDELLATGTGDHAGGFEVADSVPQPLRLQVAVEGNCYRAGLHDAVIAYNIFETVLHEESNTITLVHPLRNEVVSQVVSAVVDLRIRSAYRAVDKGYLAREKPGTPFEKMMDKCHAGTSRLDRHE